MSEDEGATEADEAALEERSDDARDADEPAASDALGAREPATPRLHGGILRGASLVLLLLVVACLGGGAVAAIGALFRTEPAPPETLVIRPTSNVVVAVRDLARLESASYHMERVIDLTSRQSRFGGIVEAHDTILLVAAADVIAGVDLSEMGDGDIVIEPEARRAVVTLPAVQILSARLDNERTYVHSRDTDLLARRRESLETQARREAEQTLRQAAIEAGILPRAERNAAHTVTALVRSLGYDEVVIHFRDEE